MSSQDLGKLILRLSIGILILLHGIAKITGGIGGIIGMVEAAGLPGYLAYMVYVGEVLAPLLLIIGLFTRPAALIIFINMLVALYLVHMKEIVALNEKTGGWAIETQALFLFGALAIAFLGAGRLSVGGEYGRFN